MDYDCFRNLKRLQQAPILYRGRSAPYVYYQNVVTAR